MILFLLIASFCIGLFIGMSFYRDEKEWRKLVQKEREFWYEYAKELSIYLRELMNRKTGK